MESSDCLICAFPFDSKTRLRTYSSCGHEGVCSVCFLRMRAVQRKFSCPTCKCELEKVICSKETGLNFSDFNIWGDSIGPDFTYDERGQMFFPNDYYKSKVQSLWLSKCNLCFQVKRDMKGLKTHAKMEHNLDICNLCIENRQLFPSEHRYYTQQEYEKHLRQGDGDGFLGHPMCEFCRKRFYDRTAIFIHLNQEHYTCHICTKLGKQYIYYHNYDHLEDHFRTEHYLCEDPVCLEKKFVVFPNSIDLVAHERNHHPFAAPQKKVLPMRFKVRRAGESDDNDEYENQLKTNHHRTDPDATSSSNTTTSNGNNNMNNGGSSSSSGSSGGDINTSNFDGGLGGRASNGQWQVEILNAPLDPRDPSRSTGTAMAAVDLVQTSSQVLENMNETDFPSLPASSNTSNRPQWGNVQIKSSSIKKPSISSGGSASSSVKSRVLQQEYPALPPSQKGIQLSDMKKAAFQPLSIKKVSSTSSLPLPPPPSFTQDDFPSMISNSGSNSSSNSKSSGKSKMMASSSSTQSMASKLTMSTSSPALSSSVGATTTTSIPLAGTTMTSYKPPPPADVKSTEAYPELGSGMIKSSSSAVAITSTQKDKSATTTSIKATSTKSSSKPAVAGWGTALSSAGISVPVKEQPKKEGITVVKLSSTKNATSSSTSTKSNNNNNGLKVLNKGISNDNNEKYIPITSKKPVDVVISNPNDLSSLLANDSNLSALLASGSSNNISKQISLKKK